MQNLDKLQNPTPTNLSYWRWIVINSSGGKDSQTALHHVMQQCDLQGIDRSKIVVSHQCLGKMEWDGTRELVERQADHYGLRVEVSRYRDRNGLESNLLDYVRARRKWPDNKNRFCTSEFKRGPGGRIIVKLWREAEGPILNIYGFRADESPARSKKIVFGLNPRFSSNKRKVYDWLPIHTWNVDQVWASIRSSGVPHHRAYDLGMSRLSCRFCIFAPRNSLLISGIANPQLLDEYCNLENEIGHTFQNGKPINAIRDAIRAGEQPKLVQENWNM